jgi:hypothetical protein
MAVVRHLKCTAQKKRGGRCTQWARTGYQVCHMHGAGTKATPGGAPITTGRYSRLQRERVRALYEAYLADPDPLNLQDELALLRALVQDFVDRYDAWREALLSWHASFTWHAETEGDGPPVAQKPRHVLDITDAYRLHAEIGRMVERIETIRAGATVNQRDVAFLLRRMAEVVERHVLDDGIREQIQAGWHAIIN